MVQYNAEVHTADALARQIEDIYSACPETLLVGSLGRAAAFESLTGDYLAGFEQRSLLTRPDGTARDIDILPFYPDITGSLAADPYEVDTGSYKSRIVSIDRQNGDWFLLSAHKRFEAQLHPAVMEPVEATMLGGVSTLTLPAQTQLNMIGLRGLMREKDVDNRSRLQAIIETSGGETLPDELYRPFRDLRTLWAQSVILRLREHYRSVVPVGVRKHLTPLHRLTLDSLMPK